MTQETQQKIESLLKEARDKNDEAARLLAESMTEKAGPWVPTLRAGQTGGRMKKKNKPRIQWAAVDRHGWIYCSTIRPTLKQCKAHFIARFFETSGQAGAKAMGFTFKKVSVGLA